MWAGYISGNIVSNPKTLRRVSVCALAKNNTQDSRTTAAGIAALRTAEGSHKRGGFYLWHTSDDRNYGAIN